MARLNRRTISRRTVEALEVEKDTVFWDSELMGFGVRVYPSGSKYYVVQTRAGGAAAKRVTVGRHGVVSAEEARRRAALVIARIKAGEEPTPEPMARRLANGPTVAALAARYLEEHVAVRCKRRTRAMYRLVVDKYILPEFGQRSALAVEHAQVAELHYKLRETPAMANHVVDTLSRIFNRAEDFFHRRSIGYIKFEVVVTSSQRPSEFLCAEACHTPIDDAIFWRASPWKHALGKYRI